MLDPLKNESQGSRPSWPFCLPWRRSSPERDIEIGQTCNMQMSDATRQFLTTVTSLPINGTPTTEQRAYVDFIEARIKALPAKELHNLLASPSDSNGVSLDEVFVMLAEVAASANSVPQFGIDTAIEHLVQKGIFSAQLSDLGLTSKARNIMFIAISWICMLYSAMKLEKPFRLLVDKTQNIKLQTSSLDMNDAEKSICEIIQHFGPLMPVKSDYVEEPHRAQGNATTLYVSQLNGRTLSQIGGIKIRWIDNLSSHLSFDMEDRCLMMFALPSFCEISMGDTTTLARIISNYYDSYSKPEAFSLSSYLKEIRLSYQLIFQDDKRAQKYFASISGDCKVRTGIIDPTLIAVCQSASRSTRRSTAYSIPDDFPILGPRLSRLQQYIQRQESGTIAMLWRDRRDMLRWYTFWVVTIVGSIGVILATAQVALGAAQVYYSNPAHGGRRIGSFKFN